MTELIKQRLVGMIIVVIAGVVFIPDLLDGQKQTSKADFKKIPDAPSFDNKPNLAKFPQETVDKLVANVDTSEPSATDDETSGNDSVEEFEPGRTSNSQGNTTNQEENDPANNASSAYVKEIASELSDKDALGGVNSNQTGSAQTQAERSGLSQPAIKPSVTPEFKKDLWILQLGSFKHKENVITLRDKLKSAGFETYIKPVATKSGVLSKVYIGPSSSKKSLEEAQIKAKELTGLFGKITRFKPTN